MKKIANAVLYLPRIAMAALLTSAGNGVRLMDDEHFIERLERFIYLYEKNLGWYPVISFTNSRNPNSAARFFTATNHFLFPIKPPIAMTYWCGNP